MRTEGTRKGAGVGTLLRLCGALALLALALAATASSVSAKTVYDYVYSGTYLDGSGSAKGSFPYTTGDVGLDRETNSLLIPVGAEPGYVTKYNPDGTLGTFSALSSDTMVDTHNFGSTFSGSPELAVDNSGTATDGNFYVIAKQFSNGPIYGFKRDGTPTGLEYNTQEGVCGIGVAPNGDLWASGRVPFQANGHEFGLIRFAPDGKIAEYLAPEAHRSPCNLEIDTAGNLYVTDSVGFFETPAFKLDENGEELYQLTSKSATEFAIDEADDDVFVVEQGGVITQYDSEGAPLETFGEADPGHSFPGFEYQGKIGGMAVDPATHDVWISHRGEFDESIPSRVEKFIRSAPITVPTTKVEAPETEPTAATLKGTVDPDAFETTDCHFEWGTTASLGNVTPCAEGTAFSGNGPQPVTAELTNLSKGTTYFYRLSSRNANGRDSLSAPLKFIAQGKPIVSAVIVDHVNTDGARLNVDIDPNGGNTKFHFEWGTEAGVYDSSTPTSERFGLLSPQRFSRIIGGLQPETVYHFRVVAENEAGVTFGPDQVFNTYIPDPAADQCANAQVRQQVEASLLLDCRAYELVSAANAGGFDVESSLAPGQNPYVAYPYADGRVVYSVHNGIVPGVSGSPTNFGRDPYVATRGANGWTTRYVGLPASGMADDGSYGSPLLAADPGLNEFAFGGPNICSPCFSDGSTNIPLRLADGSLVKGMAGSLEPPADPVGEVRKRFSDDGLHLVFGSEEPFEDEGNDGSISIYERNLGTGETQLISTMPDGATMTGTVAELDVSADGSRVLVGRKVGEDGYGNEYFDLYMHVDSDSHSIPVLDAPSGAIFSGMTADGDEVYFTTPDQLADDSDASADLFRADLSGSGATLTRVSTGGGGTGNSDSCTAAAEWNVAAGEPDCSVVTIAGGAGVAADSGTVFFATPELLDGAGNGVAGQANLYRADPGGAPQFVALLDTTEGKPGPKPPTHELGNPDLTGSTSLSSPGKMAIDEQSGDIYVVEHGAGRIARFDDSGQPDEFTEGPGSGTSYLSAGSLFSKTESQIAVDNAPGSPLRGALYVTSNGSSVLVFSSTGKELGSIGGFGEACGVAVDPSNGAVYVGDYFNHVWRFLPTSSSAPVSEANYTKTGITAEGMSVCNVGADGDGHAYAFGYPSGPLKRFPASSFAAGAPSVSGQTVTSSGNAIYADPGFDLMFVDQGARVVSFDQAGGEYESIEDPSLGAESSGVAVDGSTGRVYATSSDGIVSFDAIPIPYFPIDNPAIFHGMHRSAVRSYEDFQVTPDGRYAAFSSVVPATGYPTLAHSEIYRYDAQAQAPSCASCAPTGASPATDVKLSPSGRNLTDDGRVFFTTREAFALRDTNEKDDAYEWSNGKTQLVSAGTGGDNSRLLSVSADGRDAFFFTRDRLVHEDQNGSAVKIYDAREGGGHYFDPAAFPCAASDECHGAGTQPPGPPSINTVTGSGRPAREQVPPKRRKRCAKAKVRRQGKCVKRHRNHRHHAKRHTGGGKG